MKRTSILLLSLVVLMAVCFSSCHRRFGYGAGAAGAPPPPPPPSPPKVITVTPGVVEGSARYAALEGHFKKIARTKDEVDILMETLEVLELCESDEVQVMISEQVDGTDPNFTTISIRDYLKMLQNTKKYREKIDDVAYNVEGKITSIALTRD